MAIRLAVKVTGLEDVLRQLRELPDKLRKKTLRAAASEVGGEVLRTAKANVPVRTKALRKSLGKKVKVYSRAVVVIVGPRSGHWDAGRKRFVRKRKKGYRRTPGAATPTKYAHLAEFGTVRSRAKPFMQPALSAAQRAARGIFWAHLSRALAQRTI